jgi:hypothetical protein
MTEQEWLECDDIHAFLDYLVGRASNRKFRLFGCACCRRIWNLMVDERSRNAVSVAERYSDARHAGQQKYPLCKSHSVSPPLQLLLAAAFPQSDIQSERHEEATLEVDV